MTPTRTVPASPRPTVRASANARSAAASTSRPEASSAAPAGVRATSRVVRSSRATPSSRSSCATDLDTACWARWSRSAARVKLSSSATATNARSRRRSGIDARRLWSDVRTVFPPDGGIGLIMANAWTSRTLGSTGPAVSALGLGAMGMSDLYGPSDEGESIATLHAAIDAGVSLIDTGDFYGSGRNELLIARRSADRDRDAVTLSVKFGALRDPAGGWLGVDGRPAAVKNFAAYTLSRLGTDHIDVYRPARLDPDVPIEETVGAMAELVQAGHVRHIGLSEVGAETIRRAAAVHPISDVQIEYSLLSRGIEEEILPAVRELGIGVTAYGVLSRGLLSGHWSPDRALGGNDFRARSPRFQRENLEHNLALVERLREVGEAYGASVAQIAIAWVLSRGDDIVPLVGARRRDRLHEALGAIDLELGAERPRADRGRAPGRRRGRRALRRAPRWRSWTASAESERRHDGLELRLDVAAEPDRRVGVVRRRALRDDGDAAAGRAG